MPSPTSIRFDKHVMARLTSYVARHPGLTRSAVAARYVDEGLRMEEHPGIVYRDGATGRRATLINGPDVWEVVRALTSARAAEPTLSEAELLALLEESTGLPARMTRTALEYWAAYPDEVDAFIDYAERAEAEHASAAGQVSSVLSR